MSTEVLLTPTVTDRAAVRIDFRQLAEQSTVGLWVIDTQGRTLYANAKTGDLMGVSPADMAERPFTDFMEPEEVPLAEFYFARRVRGISETHEFKFRRSDGHPVWVLVQSSPIVEDGQTTAWVGRLTDIGEAVMDRHHARRLSETLRRIVALSSHPVAVVSADSTIRSVNRAFEALTGRCGETLAGTPLHELFSGGWIADWRDSGNPGATNSRVTLDVGDDARQIDVVALPMLDENNIDGSILLFTDVTQIETVRARLQQERTEMEQLVREKTRAIETQAAAIEATVEGMAVLEEDTYVWMNPAYARLRGWTVEELFGRTWQQVYAEPTARFLETVAKPILARDGYWRGEVVGQMKDGRTCNLEISMSLSPRRQVVSCCRDITERKKQQARMLETLQSLDAANDQLREAGRLKDLFVACMSHELRTPLHSILGTAEVVLDGCGGDVPPAVTAYLQQIQGSGDHLLTLINDILEVSKIGAGQLTLDLTDASAEYLLGTALDMVARRAATKALRVVRHLPEQPLTLKADQVRVVQILANLLSNAVKFTPTGGEIHVTLRAAEEGLQFVVADTGIGFDQKSLHLLFQPFRQLDGSLTRRHGGTGLGLYLARQLAELHGGTITATGVPGQGAEFILTLPCGGPQQA